MSSAGLDLLTKSSIPRIHGLIIGINKYQSHLHEELQGCVDDAKSMLKYFTDDLGVPAGQFKCLFNEHATRDTITGTFVSHLIQNPNIRPRDPIVIYFAGHGSRMPAPPGWQAPDGKVEMILSHDASTLDARGYYNFGIPDLTLAYLLYKLSQQKGNNITVILDSCHSGSGTRGDVRVRGSNDPDAPPIPATLDVQLRNSLSVDYPSEVEHDITGKQPAGKLMAPSLESHILLAACREDEQAQEIGRGPQLGDSKDDSHPTGGVFTNALLKELRRSDLATTSYTTLIRNLLARREYHPKKSKDIGSQTFQCEGRNQDRLLFSIQYSTSKGKMALMSTSDKSVYRVRVGSAQGVVPGTEFGVFWDKMDPTAPPITLVARSVGPIMSQLHGLEPNAPPNIPGDAYASIIKYNDHSNGVRIWVDDRVRQSETWRTALDSLGKLPIYWATSPGSHDIALLPHLQDVQFRGAHLIPGTLEVCRILKTSWGAKKLGKVLTAMVYFHFHIKIQNPEAPVRALVSMKLWELNEKSDSWGSIIYEPKEGDLFGDSVPTGTVATLRPDPYKAYGIEITNNSTEDLFPYVLYYDFEDYSVGCLYEPPSRSVKSPFKAGGSLTIGYGSGGSQPLEIDFTNFTSQKEYGAFVLMVFSEWADVGYLQQQSPFGPGPFDGRASPSEKPKIWDSVVARIQLAK